MQSALFPPPTRSKALDVHGFISEPLKLWLFTVQNLLPLVTVDTSAGDVPIALPPAGLNSATGQSNQNVEITYRKITIDGNTVTITGSADGSVTLTAGDGSAASRVKFKSDGTNWWITG